MIYVFDGYELDARLYELRRAGQSLPLEPKVFDLIAYLIEHRHRIVSRQELFDHLWPDLFVSDTTFDHCMMMARKAIGDDGRRQARIKTIRRRGYRFVADLEERPPDQRPDAISASTFPAQRTPHTHVVGQVTCPHCQHEHPGEARFCSACGSPLWVICRQCHGENLPGGSFCTACGHTLSHATPALAGAQAPLSLSYTPRHLAHDILTNRSALEGEHKQVTVLFCDIDDSMVLAERLGPEGMHTLLNRFFELALETVHRYGGVINQFLGDGFMALFGAPVAHEDHARRAVLSALELQSRMYEQQPDFARIQAHVTEARPLAVRVCMGLNTGSVVVGSIGDNLRMDYTAVGDTTNLAARLQQFAEPGTILSSQATTKLVPEEVDFDVMGPITVKGKAEPVPIYKVVGRGRRRPLLGSRPIRVLSRFVGRERELHTLHTILAQVERGQGQVVGIVAEPGMGKSRLLYEFRQRLTDQPVTYLEGRCVSYGNITPYAPVLDMLRYHWNSCKMPVCPVVMPC